MEDGPDLELLEMLDQCRAEGRARSDEVIHVPSLLAMGRNVGLVHVFILAPLFERVVIGVPEGFTPLLDDLPALKLSVEKSSQHVAHHITGADINPAVLHLATKKIRSVGALLANDFRALNEIRPINEQCAALATSDILGLVEALGSKGTHRAEPTALVFAE